MNQNADESCRVQKEDKAIHRCKIHLPFFISPSSSAFFIFPAMSDSKSKLNPHVPFGPLPVAVIGCGAWGGCTRGFTARCRRFGLWVFTIPTRRPPQRLPMNSTPGFDRSGRSVGHGAAATIAVPTVAHPEYAKQCMDAGVACLIEKPLAKDVAEARQIVDWAAQHGTVQVGHIERFNPAIRAMRGYAGPGRDLWKSPASAR